MFLDVEKAEEFMKLLEAENDREIPIFIAQVTQYAQNGMATTMLSIQYQYDHCMIVRYRDNVGSAYVPRDAKDSHAVALAQELNRRAEEKKNSIIELMKKKGYNNIVNGTWMGV